MGVEAEPDGRRGRFFRSFGLLFLGTVPGFLAVDRFVGWLDREQGSDQTYYLPDDRLGWSPRPYFERPEFQTRLDRFGLRSEAFGEREPGEVRILGLGSSRFYGAASVLQPDVWSYALEAELLSEGQGPVRVLNGAVMAYSGVQSCWRGAELLEREVDGLAVEPDLVLLPLSPAAQLMLDPRRTQRWVRLGEDLVPRDVLAGWPEPLWPLRAGIHGFLMRSNLYVRHQAQFSVSDEGGLEVEVQRWCLSRAPQPAAIDRLVDLTLSEYAAFAETLAQRDVALRVLVLPESFQDSEERWERYLRDYAGAGAPPAGTPRLEGVELLLERCAQLGLSTWDLTAEVTELGRAPERNYAKDAVHWSGAGHGLIARGIARRLRDEGLIETLRTKVP